MVQRESMDPRESKSSIKILMLPWLAHGHISPFLELAKALSKRHFYIYLCSTPITLTSIKQNNLTSIKLVEIHLPSLPELPPHYHTTNGLPPHLMATLKRAFDMSKPTFSSILDTIKPDLLIYDLVQPWAPEVASSRNIPAVLFLSAGAAASSYLSQLHNNPYPELPSPAFYVRDYERVKIDRFLSSTPNDLKDRRRLRDSIEQSWKIVLIKTSRAIEGKYIDYLSPVTEKRIVPVGPLVQEPVVDDDDEKPEIIQWLDKKEHRSTVFASFGSEYFLSKEEMEEIAYGLELSGVNFIWVVRFPVGEGIRVEEALPQGFVERVKERGKVVEGWAPQAKILGHGGIGGFVSHCGWSSVMEGIEFGVPIIALPMNLDQPLNGRLVEEVGVGVEVKRDWNGRVEREEVARVIKDVVRGESGEIIRSRANELREEMRERREEEMDGVVEELVKLCRKGK